MKKIAFIKDETGLWTIWAPIFEKKGYEVVLLDVYLKLDQDRLLDENWDAFIWRAKHDPWIKNLGKRYLSFFDLQRNIKTFPSFRDYSHYDDKISQYFIMRNKRINTPKTFIFFDKNEAQKFMDSAELPLVFKATSGSGSSNVNLVKSTTQGKKLIRKAFGKGIKTFFKEEPIHRYCYYQEFIPGNTGDYKIICFGDKRITGFFRKNVEDEIKKSRSEFYKFDLPDSLLEFISGVNEKLGSLPVMSYDVIQDTEGNWFVTEFGVIYGDINNWDYYQNSKCYERDSDGNFKEIEKSVTTNDELFIDLLLKDWGWID